LTQIKPGKAGTRLLGARSWPLSFSDLFPMSSDLSLGPAVDPPLHREETLQVAALLSFASGYVDRYTWIIHGVLANQGREVGMFRRSVRVLSSPLGPGRA
jgi:hypothetical protein